MNFIKLEKITNGKILQLAADKPVSTLIVDSRKAVAEPGALFFAIQGERHNGHNHIPELYAAGVRQFVIEQHNQWNMPDANILKVSSSIDALQAIAVFHRQQFSFPVIGITGSNGKTIIKEWLYQLLSRDFVIVKNPGSYNSQVGVPLSVWQIQAHHQLGIFEAGISKPGEMQRLQRIILPDIGIFTNIGSAHSEGFTDVQEKIREKLKLFTQAKLLIYCHDHANIDRAIKNLNIPTLSWGFKVGADIFIRQVGDSYLITTTKEEFTITLPFTDKASLENCFHCIAVLLYLNTSPKEIKRRVMMLRSVTMRLELKEGINRCQIIDDTYNNDLAGLQVSIEFLTHQQQKSKKRLILSDILQSGMDEKELVSHVAGIIHKNSIHAFTGIGAVLSKYKELFKLPAEFFSNTETYINSFNPDTYQDEIILVKGARSFQFEKIVQRLQRKVHGTVMEINLGNLVHNLNFIRTKIKPSTKLMVMVKAFAYGSGSIEVANILQYHKVNYLGVAYADEGVELRKNNITIPIMVMNPSEESFEQLINYNLEPEIYNFKIFNALIQMLSGRLCQVHIKLDTGMHRLGFEKEDIDELIKLLTHHPNIRVASIFSHLAGADEKENDAFSFEQADKFKGMAEKLIGSIGYQPLCHIINSPGILRLPALQMDMVRLGIALYGIDPTNSGVPLKPVATLKTIISQIKEIQPGETIGYGRRGKAISKMKLATIAIGYADGFSRAFSHGKGEVLIHGMRAKVVGIVCMDMTMIDVSGIDAHEGDEVIIYGEDLPIQEVASKINTISYEILTNTSERVKRVFVAEGI